MSKKRLIVVSFDAMVYEDLDRLKDKPVFSKFFTEGSRVNRIKTIYPSLTYPAHTSILTGCNPGKHGVVNNEPSVPGNLKCPWFWFHDAVKVSDIHDAAKKAGLTTASIFWPVTGAHKSIDWLVAEYWAQGPDDTLEAAYKRAGTNQQLFDECVVPLKPILKSWNSVETDEAKITLTCDVIKKYKPDFLTLHMGQVDWYRHRYGEFNDKVDSGVDKSERFMQMIFDACKEAGTFEETNFIIVSDHGQINYTRKMNLNVLFRQEGLIRTDEEGNFKDCDVWAKSANYSAHIFLQKKNDKALYDKVYGLLNKWCSEGDKGISRVLTAEQAKEMYGLYGDFEFVIESDETTLFFADWRDPLFKPYEPLEEGYQRGSHGHEPSVGPQPVFLAWGPQIKKGIVVSQGRIIDEAPTFAKILGVDLPDAEGKPMDFILK